MRKLVADLAVLNTKFHNLHWNVKGPRFVPVHEALEDMYNEFFAHYDEVAERMRMLGVYAPAALKDYLALTDVEELPEKDFDVKEVITIVKASYEGLKASVQALRDASEDDAVTAAMCDDLETAYDKRIWFASQQLK
jgi:starvation-inducible DNA-binding protein